MQVPHDDFCLGVLACPHGVTPDHGGGGAMVGA